MHVGGGLEEVAARQGLQQAQLHRGLQDDEVGHGDLCEVRSRACVWPAAVQIPMIKGPQVFQPGHVDVCEQCLTAALEPALAAQRLEHGRLKDVARRVHAMTSGDVPLLGSVTLNSGPASLVLPAASSQCEASAR